MTKCKLLFAVAAVACCCVVAVAVEVATTEADVAAAAAPMFNVDDWAKPVNDRFSAFLTKHGKAYNAEEHAKRFQIFQERDAKIREHNAGQHSYKLGHNAFSDLSPEEFKQRFLLKTPAAVQERITQTFGVEPTSAPAAAAPVTTQATVTSLNWGSAGALNPIQSQGCNDCWSFATTSAFETSHAIDKHVLYKFSEQNMLDCSGAGDCVNGGYPSDASAFAVSTGLYKAANYASYHSSKGTCTTSSNYAHVKAASYAAVQPTESGSLFTAAQSRPVIMTISVDDQFDYYRGGIFDASTCNTAVTGYHAVPIVGFGTENGVDYWVIRNSWGTGWGENGYMRMKRNANICHIGTYMAYTMTFDQTGASCPAYSLATDTDYYGFDIANAAVSSFAGCAALCASTQACGSWTLYQGVCYMKTLGGATQATTKSGLISGKCVNSNGACHTYTTQANTDYYGNDLAQAPAASVAECFGMCQLLSGCGSFTYASGVCYMKNSAAPSGAVASTGATAGKCVAGCSSYMYQTDTDYYGNDISRAPAATLGECFAQCKALNTCQAFTLNQGVCYLKTTNAGAIGSSGVTSGFCTN